MVRSKLHSKAYVKSCRIDYQAVHIMEAAMRNLTKESCRDYDAELHKIVSRPSMMHESVVRVVQMLSPDVKRKLSLMSTKLVPLGNSYFGASLFSKPESEMINAFANGKHG